MIKELCPDSAGQSRSRQGVICLFCGTRIALHQPATPGASAGQVSIVWCGVCGREAPYLPAEVIELRDEPTALNFWCGGIRPV
jgi:hypothetical protein